MKLRNKLNAAVMVALPAAWLLPSSANAQSQADPKYSIQYEWSNIPDNLDVMPNLMGQTIDFGTYKVFHCQYDLVVTSEALYISASYDVETMNVVGSMFADGEKRPLPEDMGFLARLKGKLTPEAVPPFFECIDRMDEEATAEAH